MGENDALGFTARTARRDHERITVLDWFVEAQRADNGITRGGRQARVDWRNRVARVPGAAHGIDERGTVGVDRYQSGHGR